MLFNSFPFFIFLIIVIAIYWLLNFRHQNLFLLTASYFFYGLWEMKFLALILISTLVDYTCSLFIYSSQNNNKPSQAKFFLYTSVVTNLSILFFFKSYGFFIDDFKGIHMMNKFQTTDILIPIGISFYTFQTMSYTIDVYRKEITPTRNFINFALYVSYFPQLVAGPIESAKNLLTQIQIPRRINTDQFLNSIYIIIWGLFLKVVLADNQASIVAAYIDTPYITSTTSLILICWAGAFQLYGDFAGYSSIAIGVSGLLGIKLSENFRFPFFSSSPQEFWSRWHITLIDWFRAYLYFPLLNQLKKYIPLKIASELTQVICLIAIALWHGFSWTFFIWGLAHAFLYSFYSLRKKDVLDRSHCKIRKILAIIIWFNIFSLLGIIFRMKSISHLGYHLQNLTRGFEWQGMEIFVGLIFFVPLFLFIEYWHYRHKQAYFFNGLSHWKRCSIALFIYTLILLCGVHSSLSFIYFQF